MTEQLKTSDITSLNYEDMPIDVLKAYLVEHGVKFGANSGDERIKTLVHDHLVSQAPEINAEADSEPSEEAPAEEATEPEEPEFDESPVGADAIVDRDTDIIVELEKPEVVTQVAVYNKFGKYEKTFTLETDGVRFQEIAVRYAGQIGGGDVKAV